MFAPDPSMEESVLEYMSLEQKKGSVPKKEKVNSDKNDKWPKLMPERLNELFTKTYLYHRLA